MKSNFIHSRENPEISSFNSSITLKVVGVSWALMNNNPHTGEKSFTVRMF
ncbi:hypothetical protein C1H46_038856 [Malus baccata]|uniref:Uncharacterized protein n=1 Tax=Malus baccata TaxID=106549 RepID=A0A540KN08_MALBA|nr:hypothetical protein C1H46_038856 [Malus baccata]